jgi:hypothetical protein
MKPSNPLITRLLVLGLILIFAKSTWAETPAPKGSDVMKLHSAGIVELSADSATSLHLPRKIAFEMSIDSQGSPIASQEGRSKSTGTYKLKVSDPETQTVYIESVTTLTTESVGSPEQAVQNANTMIAGCLKSLLGINPSHIDSFVGGMNLKIINFEILDKDGRGMKMTGEANIGPRAPETKEK